MFQFNSYKGTRLLVKIEKKRKKSTINDCFDSVEEELYPIINPAWSIHACRDNMKAVYQNFFRHRLID